MEYAVLFCLMPWLYPHFSPVSCKHTSPVAMCCAFSIVLIIMLGSVEWMHEIRINRGDVTEIYLSVQRLLWNPVTQHSQIHAVDTETKAKAKNSRGNKA